MKGLRISTLFGLGVLAAISQAQPVFFNETATYYDFIDAGAITWTNARAGAASLIYQNKRGRLVTINTASENAFLQTTWGTLGKNGWIGLYQPAGSVEPDQGWTWISGEPTNYVNWSPGEPNNNGGESYAHMYATGTWNDDQDSPRVGQVGYYVEYADAVPEPATWLILAAGAALLAKKRRA